jgi:hypothetical protein
VISLCKYNGHASVRNSSEKEDSSHGSKAKSTVDCAESGSGTGLGIAVAAGLVGGLVAACTGVLKLALAVELAALNELLVLKGLVEVGASISDIAGRLEVEDTLDAVKCGSLDTSSC